jgi:hypothetical protein
MIVKPGRQAPEQVVLAQAMLLPMMATMMLMTLRRPLEVRERERLILLVN